MIQKTDAIFIEEKMASKSFVKKNILEKYITFSVPLKKENDNDKKITCKLNFIDSYKFMSTSLSNLVDNLSGVYDKECKRCMKKNKIG